MQATQPLSELDIECFRDGLDYIFHNEPENVRAEFAEFFASPAGAEYNSSFPRKWRSLQDQAQILSTDFRLLDLDDAETIDAMRLFLRSFRTPESFLDSRFDSLQVNALLLTGMLSNVPRYVYERDPLSRARDMRGYERTAFQIRSSRRFKSSILCKVEKLIPHPFTSVKRTIDENQCPPDWRRAHMKLSFVALVSPSMTGKTQFAFVLKKVKPLYFICEPRNQDQPQRLYYNFTSLSGYLRQLIFEDLIALKDLFPEDVRRQVPQTPQYRYRDTPKAIYSQIRAKNILTMYHNFKFKTLGFLLALVNRAHLEYRGEETSISWMRYWATQGNLRHSAMSIAEFERFPGTRGIDGTCLFLDEYVGYVEFVLLRNLSRAIQLPCIVSNTNSDISNLLGKSLSLNGDANEPLVWSLVVTNLGKVSPKVFSRQYSNRLTEFTDNLAPQCEDESNFRHFLDDFKVHCGDYVRPGVLPLVFAAFDQFRVHLVAGQNFRFCDFFEFILKSIGDAISIRKSSIANSYEGQIANLCLMLGIGYADLTDSERETAFKNTKYCLQNHLYHVRNPVDQNSWLLVTFPNHAPNIEHLKIYKSRLEGHSGWDPVHTQFNEQEFLTSMACTAIGMSNSIARLMAQGRGMSRVGKIDLGAAPNPEALKRDGNFLEVQTTASIVDASRHLYNRSDFIFNGVSGLDFMKNLVRNLIDESGSQLISEFTFEISYSRNCARVFNVEDFLRRSTVPHLIVSGNRPPTILQNLVERSALRIGECSRLPDGSKLDIGFDFVFPSNSFEESCRQRRSTTCYTAVAECKNWEKAIQPYIVRQIVTKALSYGARICFISCISINDATKAFLQFCSRKKVNLYKFRIVSSHQNRSIEMYPLPESTIYQKPQMICFIFEMALIHPDSYLVRQE